MATTARLTSPGVHVPPPFVYAAAYLVGLAVEKWVVRVHLATDATRPWLVTAGWVAILAGASMAASGIMTFRLARTAVIPFHSATRLVRSGPYRITRNPMYLGLAVLYAGLTLIFDIAVPLFLLPLAMVAMQVLVIRREERYLTEAFGDDYRQYCRDVRRWL